MATGKITLTSIGKLDGWLWDQNCVGLGVRKQREKGTFYYVRYRLRGKQTVRSIGRHGHLTPDTARAKARQLLGTVASGIDPFAQPLSTEGFGVEAERHLERQKSSLKPRSYTETARYLRNHAKPLHSLRLADIDRRKVAALLAQIEVASGPTARNRARAALSTFFSWAIQEGLVDVNPVAGTAKATENGSRERVLSVDELRALWCGLGADRYSDMVRLLLLLGQRREEIGALTWAEVDLGRGMIILEPERTKNSRRHELPLSTQALAILQRQPRRNSSDLVFEGFGDWARNKARLDKRIGIAPWRLHDLRRTAATQMAELGVLPHIVEATLNHVGGHKAGVAGTYNRARYEGEMRSALQRWADHLDQITE
jgi:integrase